jgi:hypothetical protein
MQETDPLSYGMPYEEDDIVDIDGKKDEDAQTLSGNPEPIPGTSKEEGTKPWSDIDPSSTDKTSREEKRI